MVKFSDQSKILEISDFFQKNCKTSQTIRSFPYKALVHLFLILFLISAKRREELQISSSSSSSRNPSFRRSPLIFSLPPRNHQGFIKTTPNRDSSTSSFNYKFWIEANTSNPRSSFRSELPGEFLTHQDLN